MLKDPPVPHAGRRAQVRQSPPATLPIGRTLRTRLTITAGLLALVAGLLGCPPETDASQGVAEKTARTFLAAATAGKGEDAAAMFDEKMKAALSPDNLRGAFAGQMNRYGAFTGIREARVEAKGAHQVVHVVAEYEKATTTLRVVIDEKNHVSGLWFDGPKKDAQATADVAGAASQPTTPALDAPAPVQLEGGMSEEEVVAGTLELPLGGTLTLPKGTAVVPAVVLVHGSGPHDRDETIGPNKPFLDIARGLAAKGIAVYRYDKRAFIHADQMAKSSFTVFEETVQDAGAAARIVGGHPRVDHQNVFVLGHSLGGMLIPRIAKVTPEAKGFIILAGTTRPMEDVIVEQLEYMATLPDAPIAKEQIVAMKAQAAAVKELKKTGKQPAALPFGIPVAYWMDLKDYDPAEAIKSVDKPIFALQGERDYQVTLDDYQRWVTALTKKKGAMFKTYSDLNHLFMTGKGKSLPTEYEKEGHVSKIVIDDIAAFVKRAARK